MSTPVSGRETQIHPSAMVDPGAELGEGVEVGPGAIIGPGVRIGDGSRIGAYVLIERDTTLGAGCRVFHGAVLGTDPQDLKYAGEPTELVVGEYATLNRGTSASGRTRVGSDCLLMAYTHVAHDCELGDHVILSNSVNMAGHVTIGDWAIVGGVTPIHQFVRIGEHAFVGGGSRIPQDVPPYCRAAGNPPKMYGLNSVGLERRGFPPEVRQALKRAYRAIFMSGLNVSQGLEKAVVEAGPDPAPEVGRLLDFIRTSERGITT